MTHRHCVNKLFWQHYRINAHKNASSNVVAESGKKQNNKRMNLCAREFSLKPTPQLLLKKEKGREKLLPP
ncbi:MAG: hypothetical protein ACLQBC_04510, partial [Syntrophales bacterium]